MKIKLPFLFLMRLLGRNIPRKWLVNERLYYHIITYITPYRLYNLLLSQFNYITKKSKIRSKPIMIIADVCNVCNLRCPMCFSGERKEYFTAKKGTMSFDDYKKYFDIFKKSTFFIQLYNWGESLLNKDIVKIVKYTNDNNVGTEISTNLQIDDDELLEGLVKAGLDRIIISCDGINQNMYGKYRVGGSFEKTIRNLKKLVEIKKRLNVKNPMLEVQFIVFSFNENHIEDAKKLFYSHGAEHVSLSRCSLLHESDWKDYVSFLPKNKKFQFTGRFEMEDGKLKKQSIDRCDLLYRQIAINPDGKIYPCCAFAYLKNENLGNIKNNPNVWNDEKYNDARKGLAEPCKSCFKGELHRE